MNVYEACAYIISPVGMLINSFFLFLIYRSPSSSFGKYKLFMIAFAVKDIISALLYLLNNPVWISGQQGGIIVSNGLVSLSKYGQAVFLAYACILYMNVALSAYGFIFRYIQVCRPNIMKYLSKWRTFVLSVLLSSLIILCLMVIFTFTRTQKMIRLYESDGISIFGVSELRNRAFAGFVFKDETRAYERIYLYYFNIVLVLIIVVITIACINRILNKLRDSPTVNNGLTGTQHYFWLLVCQATVPTACSMAPPIVQMLLVFTEFTTPYWLSGFCSCMISSHAILNPIVYESEIISVEQEVNKPPTLGNLRHTYDFVTFIMDAFLIWLFAAISLTEAERESFYSKYLLSKGYNKDISPMEYSGKRLAVHLRVPFQILVEMDDSRQKAQLLLYVSMEWTDERLRFNETEYGFPRALLPVEYVWVPNIVIYNSLSVEYTSVDGYSLMINSSGSALIYLYATYEIFCPLDVQYFPFDTQYCSVDFETGGYALDMMELFLDIDNYVLFGNPEWEYIGVHARNNTINSTFGLKQYTGCVAKFKRNSGFYVVFLIIPTSIMAIVIFIAILLPLGMNVGEKINFGLAGFLGLLFMLTIVVNEVPRSSHFPLITLWMLVQLLLSFLALLSLAPLALIKKLVAKRKNKCFRREWNELLEFFNFCIFLIADGTFSYVYLNQVPENIPYVQTYI